MALKFSRPTSLWVIDQNNILHVLMKMINNSKTAWPTEILMPFVSFSHILLYDEYIIIFQNSIGNFKIVQKKKTQMTDWATSNETLQIWIP